MVWRIDGNSTDEPRLMRLEQSAEMQCGLHDNLDYCLSIILGVETFCRLYVNFDATLYMYNCLRISCLVNICPWKSRYIALLLQVRCAQDHAHLSSLNAKEHSWNFDDGLVDDSSSHLPEMFLNL